MVNYLSLDMAKEVIKLATQIIDKTISVYNQDGILIASSIEDAQSFSSDAKEVVVKQLSCKHIIFDNLQTTAVIYPLVLNELYVGAIQICADANEIEKYGVLIAKMASIMLLEESLKQRKYNLDLLQQNYLSEWLESSGKIDTKFVNRGAALNINITVERRIVIFRLLPELMISAANQCSALSNLKLRLEYFIKQKDSKALFVLDSNTLTVATSIVDDILVLDFAIAVSDFIERTNNFKVYVGVGEYSNNNSCKNQKKSATDALAAALIHPKKRIIFYNELTIETISHMILPHHQSNYINNVFKNYSEEEIKDLIHLLDAYYQNEGSLKETARKLHLHPNTLQYQLKKIMEKTDFDPRSLKSSAIFTLAIHFYKNLV